MCYDCDDYRWFEAKDNAERAVSKPVLKTRIDFEIVTKSHYKVKSGSDTISYLKINGAKNWYVGTIRQTLGADDLRAIADKLDELNNV